MQHLVDSLAPLKQRVILFGGWVVLAQGLLSRVLLQELLLGRNLNLWLMLVLLDFGGDNADIDWVVAMILGKHLFTLQAVTDSGASSFGGLFGFVGFFNDKGDHGAWIGTALTASYLFRGHDFLGILRLSL